MKRRPLSRIAWALLGAAAAIALLAGWILSMALRYPGDGLSGYFSAQGFGVSQAPADSPIQPGDVIVRINGRAVADGIEVPGEWRAFLLDDAPPAPPAPSAASSATYTVLRAGQPLDVVVPWRFMDSTHVLLRLAPLWLVSTAFLAALVLIVLSRTQGTPAQLFALAFGLEGANLILNLIPALGANLALSLMWFYNPLDMLTFVLTTSMVFHIFTIFPEPKPIARRWPWLPYGLYALNLALVGATLGHRFTLTTRALMFSRVFYPLAALEILAGIGLLVHTYLTTRAPGVRNQIRWLMWGLVIGPLPWLLFYNIPVALGGDPLAPMAVTNMPLVLVPLAFVFSITRRGLMTVDTIIHRSLVYGGMTGALLVFYLLVVSALNWLLVQMMGERSAQLAPMLAVMIVALAANPLRARFQAWVDRAFYRRWLDLKGLLQEVGERLSTTLQVEAMVTILVEEIPQRLHVTQAALLLRAEDDTLRAAGGSDLVLERDAPIRRYFTQHDAPLVLSSARHPELKGTVTRFAREGWELILPLRAGRQLLGLYLLGPRASGDLYGQDELETLMFLGRQIGVTLENARLYQQVERYTEDLEALVSERTRDLEHERDRLNVIIQNMADGLMLTSAEGRVMLVNPALESMVVNSQGSLRGLTLQETLDCPQLITLVEQALRDPGRVLSTDCHIQQRVLRALATALQDGAGVITVMRDMTHEVEVDRMKTEFISTVSHELRTPLTSVLGFTKLIAKSLDRDVLPALTTDQVRARRALKRARTNLDIIIIEGERLTRLINDVLDIAKMEAGKMEWHDRTFDLAMVVHQAVQGIQGLAGEKHLAVNAQLEADLPQLVADSDRIQQVLLNLLSNAVKFTDEGEVTIIARRVAPETLTQRWLYPPDNVGGILVEVHDTGMGIPKDELTNLFRRFKQVREDTLINKPKGTGLGLAICREVITHYGGVIWVESEPGEGSAFKFVLPIPELGEATPAPALPMLHQIRERVQDRMAADPTRPPTVLVVDDEPNIRQLLRQELSEVGYNVLEAAHGTEALALARRHQPDAILLDVMMPDLSGFDVTKILKSDATTADIPILILSIIEDREHGLALGADAYLTKPVETGPLLSTISSLISQVPQRPKAMVVGEDHSALEGITHLLREQGFEVVEAYDPRGAILTAQQIKPDLVILDEMVSKLNDAEVIKALRFQEQEQSYTIIVLAGTGQDTELEPGHEAEVADNG